MCTLLVEYVPSLHSAVAPAGAPAGARTVGVCGVAGAVLHAGDADFGAVGRDELVVDFRLGLVEDDDVGERRELVVEAVGFFAAMSLATPPWLEHRPLEAVDVE